MLDSVIPKDIDRGEPMEGTHRKLVAVSLVGSELPTKVGEGVERVLVVEAFLVFPVAAFNFTVVARRIGTDQLVADAQGGGGSLKERQVVAILDGEAVGELGAVVGLNALDPDAAAGIPGDGLFAGQQGNGRAADRQGADTGGQDHCRLGRTEVNSGL